jgi:hypothetical protein
VRHNPQFENLRNLDGGADSGVTVFYKYLDYRFPGSKFVLTVREIDDWLPSMEYALASGPSSDPKFYDVSVMRRMLLFETVLPDREKFIAAYHRHMEDVRRYFRGRADLLEMNISAGEGWEKLCPFLGLPVPPVPFPHLFARPNMTGPG